MAVNSLLHKKKTEFTLFIFGILLLGYTSFRAYSISFTFDESVTYLKGIQPGLFSIIFFDFPAANNHFFNTLLVYFSTLFFGNSEFSQRLPNLLSHCLYLYFSYLILRRYSCSILVICGYMIINLNPFLLDFFSLSRGYGLGAGIMLSSIYFFIKTLDNSSENKRNRLFSFWLAYFAVLSNLTFLNYYLSLLVLFFCIEIYQFLSIPQTPLSIKNFLFLLRRNIGVIYNILFLVITIGPMTFILQTKGEFNYGADEGFWDSTVLSLIQGTLYGQNYPIGTLYWLQVLVGLTFFISIGILIYRYFFLCLDNESLAFLGIISITLISVLSVILQHYLFQVRFLTSRTAIFFVPLYNLVLVQLFHSLGSFHIITKKISFLLLLIVSLFFLGHSIKSSNLTHSLEWKNNAEIRNMMEVMASDYKASQGKNFKILIRTDLIFLTVIDFYRTIYNLDWIGGIYLVGQDPRFNYYYALPGESTNIVRGKDTVVLKKFPVTQTVLSKKSNLEQIISTYEMGYDYLQKKQYDAAILQYEKLLEIYPKHAQSHYDTGVIYQKTGHLQKAKFHLTEATKYDMGLEVAFIKLANLYIQENKPRMAIKLLLSSQYLIPSSEYYNILGKAYYEIGKKDLASLHFKKASDLLER